MPVGDLVRLQDITWDRRILCFRGVLTSDGGADFATGRFFTVEEQTPPSWLRRLASRWSGGRVAPRRRARKSLLNLLDAYHDVFSSGTQDGVDNVAVPFSHILYLSGPGGTFGADLDGPIRKQIQDAVQRDFGAYIDDLVGVRVMCDVASHLGREDLLVYFGRGLFVPRDGERPTGRVTVREHGGAAEEPRLPNGQPAGLYRGQTALAFAWSGRKAPAVCEALPFDEHTFFTLGQASRVASDAPPLDLLIERGSAGRSYFKTVSAGPDPEVDVRWVVEADDHVFDVDVIADARPSRLRREPPGTRPYLEIVGLRAPADTEDEVMDRWWVDLDAGQSLVASGLARRESTIIVEGGRLSRYEWSKFGFEAGAPAFYLSKAPGTAPHDVALRRVDSGAFGYLELPESDMVAVFDRLWWTQNGYWLDWLDFAGGVEGVSGRTSGLAEAAGRRYADVRVPARRSVLGAAAPGPANVRRMPAERGTEFEIGPLLVRIAGL